MADVTRQYLNGVKRSIQESDAFVVISYRDGKGFKVSSNLNETGQIQMIVDAGEQIRKRALRYLQKKEDKDESEERSPDAGSGSSEEG